MTKTTNKKWHNLIFIGGRATEDRGGSLVDLRRIAYHLDCRISAGYFDRYRDKLWLISIFSNEFVIICSEGVILYFVKPIKNLIGVLIINTFRVHKVIVLRYNEGFAGICKQANSGKIYNWRLNTWLSGLIFVSIVFCYICFRAYDFAWLKISSLFNSIEKTLVFWR